MTLVFNLGDPKVDAADPAKNPHPALSDLKVRQAIQLGIDKAQIIKDLLGSYTKPTASVLNVGPFACQVKLTPANVNDAKSLLDSAGWRAGSDGIRSKGNQRLSLTLKTYSSESAMLNEPVAKALVPMLKNIGVELKVDVVAYREFMASWDNKGLRKHGDFDLLLFVDGTRDIDPDKFLVSAFKTSEIPSTANKGEGSNFARYASKDMDTLLNTVATTPDGRARQTAYCQIASLVANDLPRTMLYETLEVTAYNTQLQNFRVSPGPMDFTFGAADWFVKK
jgi:peptide/nickel transport system substrate-binding protein